MNPLQPPNLGNVLSLWTILVKQEFEDFDFSFENNFIIIFIDPCVYMRKEPALDMRKLQP